MVLVLAVRGERRDDMEKRVDGDGWSLVLVGRRMARVAADRGDDTLPCFYPAARWSAAGGEYVDVASFAPFAELRAASPLRCASG